MRVAILSGENYGTNYYRGTLVKRAIDRWGAEHGVTAFHTHLFSMQFLAPGAVDVFYCLRPIPELLPVELMHRLKREGRPIVVDYDDDLFAVPKWSTSSQTFDLGGIQEFCRGIMVAPDVVTTTTKAGARIVKDYAPQAETRVIPNAFDPTLKLFRPFPAHQKGDVPNVGWSGGGQHTKDLEMLEPVFRECLKRGYGLTFVGDGPRALRGLSPKHKIQWVNGSHNVEMYHQSMPIAGIDVGLAPVVDERFNHSKSALKAVEYSWLCGCPTVLSDLSCYDEIPTDDSMRATKVRGFDRDEWMAKIEHGLERMRTEGRRYCLPAAYHLRNTYEKWIEAFALAHRIARGEEAPGYEAPTKASTESVALVNV